jgi:ribonuclease-3
MDSLPPKRRLEDSATASHSAAPPSKKPRPTTNLSRRPSDSPSLLLQLDNGLQFLETAVGFSEDAKRLARDLRALLASSKSSLNSDQSLEDGASTDLIVLPPPPPTNAHTDVPPPIQPKVLGHSAIIPSPLSDTPEMPPLPPVTDLALMTAPFTHTSTLPAYVPPTNTNTYEPLEFLGDAYLELIATRLIHDRFPNHGVGQKASLREMLVKNETLAGYARAYNFGDRIKVAGAELQSQRSSTKIMADVFEAYLACVVLSDADRGFSTAEEWLARVWEPKIQEWVNSGTAKAYNDQDAPSMDIKSDLQKYLVTKGVKLEYIEDKPMELVKDGNKTTFYIGVYLTGWGYNKVKLGSGNGRSKQIAGAEAAKDAFVNGRAIVEDAHRKKVQQDQLNQLQRRQQHMNPRTGPSVMAALPPNLNPPNMNMNGAHW